MAYNNGFPATYPQMYYQPQYQPQQQAQPQSSGMIWVSGEAGAKAKALLSAVAALDADVKIKATRNAGYSIVKNDAE